MAHILVVDDDADLRRCVTAILESEGHTVAEAEDGEQAAAMLDEPLPDLILLDLMMPRMNGWVVLDEIHRRALRDRIRVLIVSGLSDEASLARGRRRGIAGHLTKPFDFDTLVAAVDDALAVPPENLQRRTERVDDLMRLLRALGGLGA